VKPSTWAAGPASWRWTKPLRWSCGRGQGQTSATDLEAGPGRQGRGLPSGTGRSRGHYRDRRRGGWGPAGPAAQYSTRYGKIEGEQGVGARGGGADERDGLRRHGGGATARPTGPDLTQVFVAARAPSPYQPRPGLRARPAPAAEQRASYGVDSFAAGPFRGTACPADSWRPGAPPRPLLRSYDREGGLRCSIVEDTNVDSSSDGRGFPAGRRGHVRWWAVECRGSRARTGSTDGSATSWLPPQTTYVGSGEGRAGGA